MRKKLNIPNDATVFISVGELNENKNHKTAVQAFTKAHIKNSYYLICGTGVLKKSLEDYICRLGISDQVMLLGFCDNVPELLRMSDIFVFPSKREGLGLAAIEGLAAGLPVIAARNRGTKEYVTEKAGVLCGCQDVRAFIQQMQAWNEKIQNNGKQVADEAEKAAKKFDIRHCSFRMKRIYKVTANK